MQYLDNDMDELFNKAGTDYPLRTDVPDFDAVLGKLNPPANEHSKRNYRKYLLLLLLLPFGYLMNNGPDKSNNGLNKKNNSLASENNTRKENNGLIEGNNTGKKNNTAKMNNGLVEENYSLNKTVTVNPTEVKPLFEVARPPFSKGRIFGGAEKGNFLNNIFFLLPKPDYSYKKPIISFPDLPLDSSSTKPGKKSKQNSSIYIGVIAGPDVSTIKYQQVKNIGFSVGILGGYKFSKRWSVETGLIYNSKKYYTDGKYFDKTKSGIPSSVYVESLDGSCNMFEVPVYVRYDFSTNRNRFFATFGATSYFMKKERYTYDAYASGSSYKGHRTYNNSGNHLFSNMQLSVGYNRQLSNNINVRIEPYIKVPVRDIGIGNMPITSSGIYFSIMQSIR